MSGLTGNEDVLIKIMPDIDCFKISIMVRHPILYDDGLFVQKVYAVSSTLESSKQARSSILDRLQGWTEQVIEEYNKLI